LSGFTLVVANPVAEIVWLRLLPAVKLLVLVAAGLLPWSRTEFDINFPEANRVLQVTCMLAMTRVARAARVRHLSKDLSWFRGVVILYDLAYR
jgi:hypothetical protein